MAEALFTLSGSALPGEHVLVGFRAHEALSQPYELELFVTVPDVAPLDAVLASSVTLHIHRPPAYSLGGVVDAVDVLEEHTGGGLARLHVVPRLALLALSRHSRVFTDQSVPEIVEQVLRAAGVTALELRLDAQYSKRAHVCQYKESDLAFVSRWLEREGIRYFFTHDDDGETLVLCDGAATDRLDTEAVRYHPVGGADRSAHEALNDFRCGVRSGPTRVTLTDYDDERPALALEESADACRGGAGVVRVHGENFATPDEGKRLARLRAEEAVAARSLAHGRGRVFQLRPGYLFDLRGHAVAWVNRSYQCVSLEQVGNLSAKTAEMRALTGLDSDDEYRVELGCIDAELPFRPPRRTPWPRVAGFEAAVIDGPAESDYAQIDDAGRYRLKLHLDEGPLEGGKASAAIRMLQPHAGEPEGFHFPLRKGTEVLLTFLGGDPDRPVIAGAVPNAHNPSKVNVDNHTRNVIHTGGDNRIEIEDEAGKQWINVRTPTKTSYLHLGKPNNPTHHAVLRTDGDCLFHFGTNHDVKVGAQLFEHVVGPVHEKYGSTMTGTFTGPEQTEVTKDGCEEEYGSTHDTLVIGQVTEDYGAGQDTTVSAAPRLEVFLDTRSTTVSGGAVDQQFNGPHQRSVGGNASNTHTGSYTRHVTGATTLTYPAGVTRLYGPTEREFKSLNWTVPGGMTKLSASITIGAPNDNWNHVSVTEITSLKLKIGMHSIGLCGAKSETTGVSIGIYKQKRDIFGVSGSANLVDISVAPFGTDEDAVKWKPKALYLIP